MVSYPTQKGQIDERSTDYTIKVHVYPSKDSDEFIEVTQKSKYAFSDYDIFQNFSFIDHPLLNDVNIYDDDVDVVVAEIRGTDGFYWTKEN